MIEIALIAVVAVIVVIGGILFIYRKRHPRALKTERYQEKWREMQKLCAAKETWGQAVVEADRLFDKALRKKGFAGKSMGERLTKAQRVISNNEGAWFGHKLRNKIEADPEAKLKESEVKQALIGIRQALKDLGALPK